MIQLGEEQLNALEKIDTFINSSEISISLSGYAGTGKSTIVLHILEGLEAKNINYVLCAPTHKATVVLKNFTEREVVTLHKLLSLSPNIEIDDLDFRELTFRTNNIVDLIPEEGIVICDECSMINDDMFLLLNKKVKERNSKIIFVGDKAQIQPVKARSHSKVFELSNAIVLTKIYRQSSESGLITTLETLRHRPIGKFKETVGTDGSIFCYGNAKDFFTPMMPLHKKAMINNDILEVKVLAYTNDRVTAFNKKVKELLFGTENEYNQYEILTAYENCSFGKSKFFNSMDYIIMQPPEKMNILIPGFMELPGYRLSLYNAATDDVSVVCIISKQVSSDYLNSLSYYIEHLRINALNVPKIKSGPLWGFYYKVLESFVTPVDLYYDNRMVRKKSFDSGYACTVHKSQGSSYNNVFLDSKDLGLCRQAEELRQLQYVALSRTRHNVHILQ